MGAKSGEYHVKTRSAEERTYDGQTLKTYRFLKKRDRASRIKYLRAVRENPQDPAKLAAVNRVAEDYPHWFGMPRSSASTPVHNRYRK